MSQVDSIEINFNINNPNSGTSGEQLMTLVFEGRVPNSAGSCTGDGTKIITTATYSQPFKVVRASTESCTVNGNNGLCTTSSSCTSGQGTCSSGKCCLVTSGSSTISNNAFGSVTLIDIDDKDTPKGTIGTTTAFELEVGKSYKVMIAKPSDVSNLYSVIYSVYDPFNTPVLSDTVMKYSLTATSNNYKVFDLNVQSGSYELGKLYKISVRPQDNNGVMTSLTDLYFYVKAASGVALNGVCGPATGTTTPTGKCLSSCGIDPDKEIAPDKITDLTKKCSSPNKCCIN